MTSGWLQDDFRMHQRALSTHLKSTQSTQRALRIREKETNHDFIIPSEPKILRLVFIHLHKQGCCKLVFGLMCNPKASKWLQDQGQIIFRSEILLNEIENEFGKLKRYWRFEDFGRIFRVYQNGFLLQYTTPYLHLKKEGLTKGHR